MLNAVALASSALLKNKFKFKWYSLNNLNIIANPKFRQIKEGCNRFS